MTQTPLAGKVAIVTGSGQGLGLAYAQELARQGASVVINDVNQDTADAAVESIVAEGGKAVAVVAPVGDTEAATALVNGAVEAFSRLDILVNNAGVLRDKSLLKMTDEDFDLVIKVHLRGTFTCVRETYRYFKENGVAGRIIAIGSPTGQYGNFGQTNYAAAKAGIVGMIRTFALEMKKAGVTANAVIPVAATAMTKTVPFFQKAVEADERGEAMPSFFRHDLGFGTAADVAGLITWLASDDAVTSPARPSAPVAIASSCSATPRPWSPSTAKAAGTTMPWPSRLTACSRASCRPVARRCPRCPRNSSPHRAEPRSEPVELKGNHHAL